MRKSRQNVTGALLLIAVAACSSPTTPQDDLDAAKERWASHGPTSYSWVLTRSCECLPEMAGPTRVVVRDGEVASRWFLPDQKPLDDGYAELFPSVDGLFDLIESRLRQGIEIVEATYDPALGYPVRVTIGTLVVDGGAIYEASDFSVESE